METNSLSIEKVFSAAWNRFGKNGLGLSVTYLCIAIGVCVIALIVGLFTGLGAIISLVSLLATHSNDFGALVSTLGSAFLSIFVIFFVAVLFGTLCETAMMNLSLGLFRGRFKGCTFAASSLPASLYFKVIVLDIIVGFLCSVSVFLFIVPVFFVAPRLMLASRYQVDGWLLGNIPLIGSVVCSAFFLLVNTAAYLQLKGELVESAEAPKADEPAADTKLDASGYSKNER